MLLIVHGMMEHAGRYSEFADFAGKNGIAVYAPDHRGHGQSVSQTGKVGHFEKNEGWERVLADLQELKLEINEEFQDIPVFLLGHSMGSLLARHHFLRTSNNGQPDYDGLILSGVTDPSPGETTTGLALSKVLKVFKKENHRSRLLARLSYETYNRPFRPERTGFDWLSTDEEQVDRYIADGYSGQPPTLGFWKEFFSGVSDLHREEKALQVPRDFPFLFVFGGNDPVGHMGKHPKKVAQMYCKNGAENMTVKIYEGDRHEILNENDRQDVYKDISDWIRTMAAS